MSRIIVKNLPKGTKEEKLREVFSQKGEITDMCLKYTKDGVFRNFAFIGYKTPESANQAIKHFNRTFFNSTKMQVEIAKDFGDKTKPRAWSKYSAESSVHQKNVKKKKQKEREENKEEIKRTNAERKKLAKEEKMKEFLGDLGDDPEFKEFLEVHEKVSKKTAWGNDVGTLGVSSPDKQMKKRNDVTFDNSSDEDDEDSDKDDEDSEGENSNEEESQSDDQNKQKTQKKAVSDLEFLKSKMASSELSSDSSGSDDNSEEDEDGDDDSEEDEDDSSDEYTSESEEEEEMKKTKGNNSVRDTTTQDKTKAEEEKPKYVLKMRGLHGKYNEKMIKEFFKPLSTKSIKLPRNARKNLIGVAYVEFSSSSDLYQALGKNKSLINGKRVVMKKTQDPSEVKVKEYEPRPWELKIQQDRTNEDEGIAETGRLFVRNLAYCCTEEDIENLFKKYGPLTEVNVPVDRYSKKSKGYAHVLFMIPEHAVKAFVELDGTVFQGRMMHILPGKPKTEDIQLTENSSFKKKKEMEQKALAKSSHNWNTLFLGANAVADAMAERYATSKSQILDAEGSESLGVRMALGETQIVSETRDFLVENGVSLDSFSQAAAPRSKTVILAKNLPAGTQEEELREKFEKFGTLGRLLLPPAGVSALIEFMEPSAAKAAFTKLAYTKFHYLPLYLEWAPIGVFTSEYKPSEPSAVEEGEGGRQEEEMERGDDMEGQDAERQDAEVTKTETEKVDRADQGSESEGESQPGCTLFVKNLNFDTTEEDMMQIFSKCGKIKYCSISKKKDMKNPGKMLSMGYGFVEYQKKTSADKALKTLQHVNLDGHQLDLKISNRETKAAKETNRKKQKSSKQKSSKILVRNIPFEAKQKEIHELFRVFGELKTVRLPKKLSGTGSHRGFGFVDFITRQDAKRAFNALCHSTHLYGRRLVLEWAEAEETIDDLRKKTAERFHDDVPSKKLKKSSIMEELKSA